MPVVPSLDFDELIDRLGGDKEFAVEILNEWVESLPNEVAELRASIERNDASSLKHKAHSLRGSALNMSAKEFARIASEIERRADETQMKDAAPFTEALVPEIENLRAILPNLS